MAVKKIFDFYTQGERYFKEMTGGKKYIMLFVSLFLVDLIKNYLKSIFGFWVSLLIGIITMYTILMLLAHLVYKKRKKEKDN